MIDLETFGIHDRAPVISIGACLFNIDTGDILQSFKQNITFESALQHGAPDGGTVKWWMEQSDEARSMVMQDPRPLEWVLAQFADWMPPDCVVWGNGATFDISLLTHVHNSTGLEVPWGFKNINDVRTIVRAANPDVQPADFEFDGTPHDALDDAKYQAKYVSAMWQHLRRIK